MQKRRLLVLGSMDGCMYQRKSRSVAEGEERFGISISFYADGRFVGLPFPRLLSSSRFERTRKNTCSVCLGGSMYVYLYQYVFVCICISICMYVCMYVLYLMCVCMYTILCMCVYICLDNVCIVSFCF